MVRARRILPWAAAALTVFGTYVAQARFGASAAVLVLASCALAGALYVMYRSIASLFQGPGEPTGVEVELLVEGAGSHEKAAALRALKDLEYERAVGKVSDEDFTALTKQYRERAVDILARMDADLAPYKKKADEAIAHRLAAPAAAKVPAPSTAPVAAEGARACAHCDAALDADSRFCKRCGKPVAPSDCPSCGAPLDGDSRFCKRCGRETSLHA